MKIYASGHGTPVGLLGKPDHSGAVNEGGEKKAREMPVHRQDFQDLQPLVKMNKVLPGDQVIGTPIALTTLQRAWYNSSLDGVSSLGSCPPFDARRS